MELQYFKAVSLFRRRNYEKCTEVCNTILEAGHENNVQMFATNLTSDEENKMAQVTTKSISGTLYGSRHHIINSNSSQQRASGNDGISTSNKNNNNCAVMPTWMMEGIWQLKMRALTQRIFIDDLDGNDDGGAENEDVEFERIATAARPGTSIQTAFVPRPSTRSALRTAASAPGAKLQSGNPIGGRALTSALGARPKSGMVRPGTTSNRPGSATGSRPASRCATARRIRATSAASYTIGDITAALYQASRLNPTIYAERPTIVKSLFQFLFYHEGDPRKAYSLCEAVGELLKQRRISTSGKLTKPIDWWWDQQRGRCLIAMKFPRKAEMFLQRSVAEFPHPDTYLLLSRMYQRLDKPDQAMQLITSAVDRNPFNIVLRTEQGRIFEAMSKPDDAVQIFRLIAKLNPINVESLACIAVNYFYENNPEMSLMYYRRILAMGIHNAELYCNIGLCCLYGGQIDLVLPCFQRSLMLANASVQRADIWYNLSFVAITTGDFNLARRCLRLCLTSDATNGAALNNLAVLSAHGGDLTKAKAYLMAAKESLSDSFEIESNLIYLGNNYKL